MGVAIREEQENRELKQILRINIKKEINSFDIVQLVRKGFPASVSDRIKEYFAVTDAEIAKVVGVSKRTILRKRGKKEILSSWESDRYSRLISILSLATEVFQGDRESAIEWMRMPQTGLGEQKPIDLIEIEAGENEVKDLLGRMKYGVIT